MAEATSDGLWQTLAKQGALAVIAVLLSLFLSKVIYDQHEKQTTQMEVQTQLLRDIRQELGELNNKTDRANDIGLKTSPLKL